MASHVHLASDLHLGVPNLRNSHLRERRFVQWMRDAARGEGFAAGMAATEIHLLGDLFDFWFEYNKAVPKGGTRLLGAIAELVDGGLPVHYHVGNHDLWTFGYLEEELGVTVHRDPIVRTFDGLTCMLGHGDGLGAGDQGYKAIKRVFQSRACQKAFSWLHPNLGIGLAHAWSAKSRQQGEGPWTSPEQEHLVQYCEYQLEAADVFVFGHRHLPIDHTLSDGASRYLNAGDWIKHHTSVAISHGEARLIHHD